MLERELHGAAMEACYIDKGFCSGARFSFCNECKRAKIINAEVIFLARMPVKVTLAHCLKKTGA